MMPELENEKPNSAPVSEGGGTEPNPTPKAESQAEKVVQETIEKIHGKCEKAHKDYDVHVFVREKNYSFLCMLRNVLLFIILFVTIYFLSPFEIVTVSTSSMAPTLPVGSVSIAIKVNENTDYEVGDIITYSGELEGIYYSRITHRIVAIAEDGTITTRGDSMPEDDPFVIHPYQIQNIVIWTNLFKI